LTFFTETEGNISNSKGFELSVVSAKGLVFDEKYRKIAEDNVAYQPFGSRAETDGLGNHECKIAGN